MLPNRTLLHGFHTQTAVPELPDVYKDSYICCQDSVSYRAATRNPDDAYMSFRPHPSPVLHSSHLRGSLQSDTDNNSLSTDLFRLRTDYNCNSQESILLLPSCLRADRYYQASTDILHSEDPAYAVLPSSRPHYPPSVPVSLFLPHILHIL